MPDGSLRQEWKPVPHDLDVRSVPRVQRCVFPGQGNELTLGVVVEFPSISRRKSSSGFIGCLDRARKVLGLKFADHAPAP